MTSLRSLALLSAAAVALSTPLSTSPDGAALRYNRQYEIAPLHHPSVPAHRVVNDSYIVMFKDGVHPGAFDSHFSFLQQAHESDPLDGDDSGLKHVWDAHIKGYAGSFSRDVVERIRRQPEVAYVEHDQIVHALETQKGAPWGLARISHQNKLNFSTFQRYEYNKHGGEGVNVYIIDTGIYIDHVEFEGRARWGTTIPKNDQDIDGNGHGTHCAGTIASRKYGVAKAATVTAVKVLGTNGSGTMSDVVAGVVWAATDAVKAKAAADAEFRATGKTKHKGSVANMSLGGGKSQALDDTVNKAVKAGLHFAVAAGNDNRDACDYSPASAELAVTVGASTVVDERAYFSNHGKCVDVFAPGLNILSTWNSGPISTNTISGTSMASPHTAGLLAYLLSIYPSTTFDPALGDLSVPALNDAVSSKPSLVLQGYARAYTYLPEWLTRVLPDPELLGADDELAPIPATLTPEQLKKALVALATPDALTDSLPLGSPNLVIFNNATNEDGRNWVIDELFPTL
ncbi:uncharacterized protein FOMMEDRAFT_101509 [Fomitiporia mediterranea MF3/22]|uniref:uncharacterized protein n=1 Tax=Fomitiporia mediterranea (strain MF3/22) TaxID=694068 RepID=UPI00044087AF|nr:uncharacterized protein FOMMEDRAFT_101509 [Fomitiporia mediterranea MF3/22]EJD08081.1 hypothetical protein FOMMEDRAFT_101509 [Fomitiporia mediterranea MF3/22]